MKYLALLALTACSVSFDPGAGVGTYSYSMRSEDAYGIYGMQCRTGYVSALSFHEMCINLLDDRLNNYCASAQRMQKFQAEDCFSTVY